ncbi:MAG: hypothetical protein Rubg2KO_18320 [Rubricoccaceae bacterium]
MSRRRPVLGVLMLLLGVSALSACSGLGGASEPDPDDEFGHRYENWERDGRETLLLDVHGDTTRTLLFDAVVESANIRASEPAVLPGEETAVEVLIKGAIPDACSVLNAAEQSRAGRFVTVSLTMRQPIDEVCAQVIRPFAFYLVLEGGFAAGSYTLTLNGTAHPFRIREAVPER